MSHVRFTRKQTFIERVGSCLSLKARTQFAPTCNAPGCLRVCEDVACRVELDCKRRPLAPKLGGHQR